MTKRDAIAVSNKLLGALYAAPHHGPMIAGILPDGKMMPSLQSGAAYAEMMQHGISTGHLNYALFDAQLEARSNETYRMLIDQTSFILSQRTHEDDATMMVNWAEMLAEHYRNNRIAKDLESMVAMARDGDQSTADLVGHVIGTVRSYIEDGSAGMNHIRKACSLALERVTDWREGKSTDNLLTGFPSIDDVLGGLPVSLMSVMAGMTSGFKTAALVEMMKRIALRFEQRNEKQAVVIFSAEMSTEKLVHRLASNLSGISQSHIRPVGSTSANDRDFSRYEDAISRVSGLEIYVNDESSPSFETMFAQCLSVQAQMPIAFVGFDYLERMDADGASEELRVSKIAKDLSKLAKRLIVPVVTLSQYSRKSESAGGQLPLNSWLRYSGKIEQEAAQIIHWYYPQYFIERGADPDDVKLYDHISPNTIYAICTKNRDGRLGSIRLRVDEETGAFHDPKDERYESHVYGKAA